jgi:hypothetical protein
MRTEVSDQVQWSLQQVEDEFLHIYQQVLPSDNSPAAALGVTALPAWAEEIGAGLRAMGVDEALIETFMRATEDLQHGSEWAHQAMKLRDRSRPFATWAIDRLARSHRGLIEVSTLLTLRFEWISMVGNAAMPEANPTTGDEADSRQAP